MLCMDKHMPRNDRHISNILINPKYLKYFMPSEISPINQLQFTAGQPS